MKLDENLPRTLATDLVSLGHDVDTVGDEHLTGQPDTTIWQAAQKSKGLLITQDLDFSDIRAFAPGSHHGIVLVRLNAPGRLALAERVRSLFASEDVESWNRCFVVVSDRKLRVRRKSHTTAAR